MITVVCTGGEAPSSEHCLSWLDAAHRVIAADGGLAVLKNLGRRADLWIGDGDSLAGPLELWSQSYSEARLLSRAKDDSDTEAAVRVALESGGEVWLIGGSGGRMDHWWANLRLAAGEPQLTRWLTAQEQAWTLGAGRSMIVGAGTVSVFPLGSGPWVVSSVGLTWPLDGVDFSRWHSLSNQAQAGATISVVQGRVMIMQPLEQGIPE